jgi:hypothetical protein
VAVRALLDRLQLCFRFKRVVSAERVDYPSIFAAHAFKAAPVLTQMKNGFFWNLTALKRLVFYFFAFCKTLQSLFMPSSTIESEVANEILRWL